MLIDSHCHLDFPEFDPDREEVIERSRQNGIAYIVNVGSSLKGSRKSVELAAKHDLIYATVGIHPHEADSYTIQHLEELRSLARSHKVVAVGEIGLDYYKNYSCAENQRRLFDDQAALAAELSLPLVIHSRLAQADTLEILKQGKLPKAVVHCFSGDEAFLGSCLESGFFVSFTCNITYKKADDLRALLKGVPLERLMLETDAPFLSPQDLRGRRNEPVNVRYLAQEIARLKGLSFDEVCSATTQNAINFFHLK